MMAGLRRDGVLKVTGQAVYIGDVHLPGMLYAVSVQSTIARGRITAIETAGAEGSPGVRFVMTHQNAPKLGNARVLLDATPDGNMHAGAAGQQFMPLQDDRIHYSGQHIA